MSAEEHALLSASSSHRWLSCPPSVRLEEQLPEQISEYAEEGKLAHSIAELKLRKYFIEPIGPKKFASELKKLQAHPLYDVEMLQCTDTYLEYIQSIVHAYNSRPYVAVEKRVDYSAYAPEGFGTGDCVVIGGSVMHVTDYKHGKGVPVDAENNPQMMLYALGALTEYSMLYSIETVKMTIIQPRLDSISHFEISTTDLLAWGESIKPVAQLAFEGKGDFYSGEWCKFCRAKAKCRVRSETMTALEVFGNAKPPLLGNEELGDILLRARNLEAWVKDLEEYALSALLRSEEINGWKVVNGKSDRRFGNMDEAFKRLIEAGYDEALLYERKPITLTNVEKLTGKKQFTELLNTYVIKPPGKPTLAQENDKREAINNKTTAAEAFGNK